jgi:ArsR family transcriptional regulator
MEPIYELQADILKTLSHPRRLQIVHELAAAPCTVGRLATNLGITQPNVSQHLAVMRASGVVTAERIGREMRYRISDPDIIAACGLMRHALDRRLARLRDLSLEAPSLTPAVTVGRT